MDHITTLAAQKSKKGIQFFTVIQPIIALSTEVDHP
jgi:hypothetical protein